MPLHPTKPQVTAIQNLRPYEGTPGASIHSVAFDDGMQIKTAVYPHGSGKPVALIAGFTGSMGYLHPFAERLNRHGLRVALIQPPGQGVDHVLSTNPQRPDGYEYTIEGFAGMHLAELGRALSAEVFSGAPLYLGGHSRAGYIVRFLASGLTFTGVNASGEPVLESTLATRQSLNDSFCGFLSLLSPIKAPEDLVRGTQKMAESLQGMLELQEKVEAWNRSVQSSISRSNDFWSLGVDILVPGYRSWRKSVERQIFDYSEHLSMRQFVEYIKGEDGVYYSAVQMARRNRHLAPYIPSNEDLEEALALQRSMLARDPALRRRISTEELMHVSKFWVGRTVQAAIDEMKEMAERGNWKTQGVSANGSQITVARQAVLSRAEGVAPVLDLLHAEGDGGVDEHRREAARDPRSRELVLMGGGHGGSLYDPVLADEMVEFIAQRVR